MDFNRIYEYIKTVLDACGKDISVIELKENVVDYSIYFYKNVVFRIKLGKKNFLYVKTKYKEFIPFKYEISIAKSIPDFIRFEINVDDNLNDLSDLINIIYEDTRPSSLSFGCCNNFIMCSDELKCIEIDPVFSSGCMYKKKLESGKVFYGKNKNI